MKKIIITAISAIAVIASVIGCQVYDSQTNKVLASWMDKNDSTIQKLEEYTRDFNKACRTFKNTPTDTNSYNKIVDAYLGFDKFYAAALAAVNGYIAEDQSVDLANALKEASDDAVAAGKTQEEILAIVSAKEIEVKTAQSVAKNEIVHNVDRVKEIYKNRYMTTTFVTDEIIANGVASKDAYGVFDYEAVKIKANKNESEASWSITSMYEDIYKLRWDYNSKK